MFIGSSSTIITLAWSVLRFGRPVVSCDGQSHDDSGGNGGQPTSESRSASAYSVALLVIVSFRVASVRLSSPRRPVAAVGVFRRSYSRPGRVVATWQTVQSRRRV